MLSNLSNLNYTLLIIESLQLYNNNNNKCTHSAERSGIGLGGKICNYNLKKMTMRNDYIEKGFIQFLEIGV